MKTKDMSRKQFLEALSRHGMKWVGFMGYVEMSVERVSGRVSVSVHNSGSSNRRAWLAFLLAEQQRIEKQNQREAEVAA